MFLLGAGASVEAGVPIASKMTEVIYNKIANDGRSIRSAKVLQFVIGGLVFLKGSKGINPYFGINIEELLNTIDLLSERDSSELNPFIASWHPLLNELELGEISQRDIYQFINQIYSPIVQSFNSPTYGSNRFVTTNDASNRLSNNLSIIPIDEIGEQLQKIIRQAMGSKTTKSFSATRETITKKLIDLVWLKDCDSDYLLDLVKICKKSNSNIATLNYDNTLELICRKNNIAFSTGIDQWISTNKVQFSPTALNIIKLHGSINWVKNDKEKDNLHPIPYQDIEVLQSRTDSKTRSLEPAIIFGGKNKLTAKGPFLALLNSFEQYLELSNELIIIGYSFSDDHINSFIGKWINRNPENHLIVIDPGFSSKNNDFSKLISELPDQRIEIIMKNASEGISLLRNRTQ